MFGIKTSPLGPQHVSFLGYVAANTTIPAKVSVDTSATDTYELVHSSSDSPRSLRDGSSIANTTFTPIYSVEHPLLEGTFVLATPDATGALLPLEGDPLRRFALSAAILNTPNPVNPDDTRYPPSNVRNLYRALVAPLIAMNLKGQGPLHYDHFVRTALSSGSKFDYEQITTWILTEISDKLAQAKAIIPHAAKAQLPKALANKATSLLQEILHPNFGYLRVLQRLKQAEKLSAHFEESIKSLSNEATLFKHRLDNAEIITPASLANEEALADDYSIYDKDFAMFLQLSDQIGIDRTAHAKAYAMQEVGLTQERADLQFTAQNLLGAQRTQIQTIDLISQPKLIDRFLVNQVRFERNHSGKIDVILDFDMGGERTCFATIPWNSPWMHQILERFEVNDPRALFGREMFGHQTVFKHPLIFGIHDVPAYRAKRAEEAS